MVGRGEGPRPLVSPPPLPSPVVHSTWPKALQLLKIGHLFFFVWQQFLISYGNDFQCHSLQLLNLKKKRISKELFHNFGLNPNLRLPIAKNKTTETNLKAVVAVIFIHSNSLDMIYHVLEVRLSTNSERAENYTTIKW